MENLALEKDNEGKYIIPANAIGNYTEDAIEVTYYYEPKQINLIIHHYKEGTESSLLEDEKISEDAEVEFDEEGNYKVLSNGSYKVTDKAYKNNLIEYYNISRIVAFDGQSLNVGDNFEFTENAELTYYYKSKEFKITTKVNPHKEVKYDEELNREIEVEVEGGEILGGEYNSEYKEENKIKYVESVQKDKDQTKLITIKLDEGYYIEEIKIISTSFNGDEEESIIYGKNKTNNSEIQIDDNIDAETSLQLPLLTNIESDKQIEVTFKKLPTLTVHHYAKDSKGNYTKNKIKEDDISIIHSEFIGKMYQTESMSDAEQKQYHVTIEKDEDGNVITPENYKGIYGEESIEVTYYYIYDIYKYTIEHYYEDTNKPGYYIKEDTVEEEAEFGEKITIKETDKKLKTGYEFEKIDYQDGTSSEEISGGTISGENVSIYEEVQSGEKNKLPIEIVPDEGYEISRILINGENYTFNKDNLKNGKLVIEAGTLGSIEEDKYIEVEFRKSSKITVKYLDEESNEEVASEEIITGFDGDGKEYSAADIKKVVPFYKSSKLGITDEEKNKILDSDKLKIYADSYVIICWYQKVETKCTIIEKHIAITEKDKKDGLGIDEGIVLDEKVIDGNQILGEEITLEDNSEAGKKVNLSRKTSYKNYVAVDGPVSQNENIIIIGADISSKEIEFVEVEVIEVRYYYEKQYEITTKVKLNDNTAGGTILPQKQNVLDKGDNKEQIEIKPEDGYRVKSIKINGEKLFIIDSEKLVIEEINTSGTEVIKLKQGYFTNVDQNIEIEVGFEKVSAKVIVKYIDIETNEELVDEKVIEGYVNDNYSEKAIEIKGYTLDEKDEEIKQGKMTKEPIIIEFYYKKIKSDNDEKQPAEEDKKPEDDNKETNNEETNNEEKDEEVDNKDEALDNVEKNDEENLNEDDFNKNAIKPNSSRSNDIKSPKTGESITIYANLLIIIVFLNISISVIMYKFRK